MLNNLFRVGWNAEKKENKNTDIICYMRRHKFLCNKEMSKNPKNWWKELILTKTIFISSERLKEFQWNFQEKCDLR